MEDLPEITRPVRVPLAIRAGEYLRDHVFRDRAVFPAVEAMRVLAESASAAAPGLEVRVIENAEFARFLEIAPGLTVIDALNEIEARGAGLTSKLLTMKKSGTTAITRALEHVSLAFPGELREPAPPPADLALGLEGICASPDPARIYDELVPFGPAWRNIQRLHVSGQGAIALVSGGPPAAPGSPLGSPFPLDASFHAACVWGQRYAGIVGFPVHIDSRVVIKKTAPGETYVSRVIPVSGGSAPVFDLWIFDMDGALCEEVRGLHMRDVSGGAISPPGWIRDAGADPLARIRACCRDLCVVELDTLTPPCAVMLSPEERARFGSMRAKRARTFLGARLALKKLARRLPGADPGIPPGALVTMHEDGRPRCPLPDGAEPYRCSASHDSRFAVAAAADVPVGIDVEEISERVMNGRHLYMHGEELSLVRDHPLGEVEASARVWSIKEAVSKAREGNLAVAWRETMITGIGEERSSMLVDGKKAVAIHAVADGHLFTLVVMA